MIVVIPMAGRGSRFSDQGIGIPKPFLEVRGRAMVEWAFESVRGLPWSNVIFVALAEHIERWAVRSIARRLAGESASVIELATTTEGQLCTVLAARAAIDTEEDLLIASADTWVRSDLAQTIASRPAACRGLISVARLPGSHWSFARVDVVGRVTAVAEKERISDLASTGLYYFANGREFVRAADGLIARGRKTRGEYYVIPVYDEYLRAGKTIGVDVAAEVWDMGTPEALKAFETAAPRLASRG